MKGHYLLQTLLAFGVCLSCTITFAQAPGTAKQDTPKPQLKIVPRLSEAPDNTGPVQIENLSVFAARLLHHPGDLGCLSPTCRILVTDFVFADGASFPNGIRFADELSSVFSKQQGTHVVDRSLFRELLETQNISSKLQNSEPTARWLAKELRASVVLIGQATMLGSGAVRLSARFLNVRNDQLIGPSSDVDLPVDSPANFVATNGSMPRPPLLPFPEAVNGEQVYRAGIEGVSIPSCFHMPNPPYTEEARKNKFSGSVTVEGVVGSDGLIREFRITKGAPFGLNQQFIKALETWKCKPAQKNGKPVATIVPFEVNFRLFAGDSDP